MEQIEPSTSETNPFESPEAEDVIKTLAAVSPLKAQRGMSLGLVLWVAWLIVVLGGIVWLVG